MTTRRRATPMMIPLGALVSNPANPRKSLHGIDDLARSIQAQGILQPLLVTPAGPGRYRVLAGHRRAEAARRARLGAVPCVVREGVDPTDETAIMLIENMQRHELSPLERAEAIGRLVESGYAQTDVARMIGVSPPTVNTYLALLELDEDSLEEVRAGNVGVMEARRQVKAKRAKEREEADKPTRGRPVQVEPPHFARKHPLSAAVKAACTHTLRPVVGRVGCGECWEDQIRADERSRS